MPGLPQKLWLETEAAGCRFSVRSNVIATMLQAAVDGFGIALLRAFLVRAHPQLERLNT